MIHCDFCGTEIESYPCKECGRKDPSLDKPNKLSKIAKHIIIDAENQEIRVVEGVEITLEYMQRVVGGLIERVGYIIQSIRPVDDLFVNEEGMINNLPYGFSINGNTFYGNGLIVGEYTESKGGYGYKGTLTDVKNLTTKVKWMFSITWLSNRMKEKANGK